MLDPLPLALLWPAPCPGTTLRKNQPLVPRLNSRITFFTRVVGFSCFWWMCDSYLGVQDIISCVLLRVPPSGGTLSVTHRRTYPLNPSPQLQRRLQHRSLAPRGSTDRNSGWCITGRRVSRLSQLNNRSSHARWKAHYSPVSGDSLLWCSFLNVVNCGKGEGTHFFSAVRGCAAVCKNQPLVPRSNFGGKVCARTDPWFCGQTLPVLGHGGGGGTNGGCRISQ